MASYPRHRLMEDEQYPGYVTDYQAKASHRRTRGSNGADPQRHLRSDGRAQSQGPQATGSDIWGRAGDRYYQRTGSRHKHLGAATNIDPRQNHRVIDSQISLKRSHAHGQGQLLDQRGRSSVGKSYNIRRKHQPREPTSGYYYHGRSGGNGSRDEHQSWTYAHGAHPARNTDPDHGYHAPGTCDTYQSNAKHIRDWIRSSTGPHEKFSLRSHSSRKHKNNRDLTNSAIKTSAHVHPDFERPKSVHFQDRDSFYPHQPVAIEEHLVTASESQKSLPKQYHLPAISPFQDRALQQYRRQPISTQQDTRPRYGHDGSLYSNSAGSLITSKPIDKSKLQSHSALPATTGTPCFTFSPTLLPATLAKPHLDYSQPSQFHNDMVISILSSSLPGSEELSSPSNANVTSIRSRHDAFHNLKSALKAPKRPRQAAARTRPHRSSFKEASTPNADAKAEVQARTFARQWASSHHINNSEHTCGPAHFNTESCSRGRDKAIRQPNSDLSLSTAQSSSPLHQSAGTDEMLRHRSLSNSPVRRAPPPLDLAGVSNLRQTKAEHERGSTQLRETSANSTSPSSNEAVTKKRPPCDPGFAEVYKDNLPYNEGHGVNKELTQCARPQNAKKQKIGRGTETVVGKKGTSFTEQQTKNVPAKADGSSHKNAAEKTALANDHVAKKPSKQEATVIELSSGGEESNNDSSDSDSDDLGQNKPSNSIAKRHILPAKKPTGRRNPKARDGIELPPHANIIDLISPTTDEDKVKIKQEHVEESLLAPAQIAKSTLTSNSESMQKALRHADTVIIDSGSPTHDSMSDSDVSNKSHVAGQPLYTWYSPSPTPSYSSALGPREMPEEMAAFLDAHMDDVAQFQNPLTSPFSSSNGSIHFDLIDEKLGLPIPSKGTKDPGRQAGPPYSAPARLSGDNDKGPMINSNASGASGDTVAKNVTSTPQKSANETAKQAVSRPAMAQKPGIFVNRPTSKNSTPEPAVQREPEPKRLATASTTKSKDPRVTTNTASPSKLFKHPDDPRAGAPHATPSNMFDLQAPGVKFDVTASKKALDLEKQHQTPPVAKSTLDSDAALLFEDKSTSSAHAASPKPYSPGLFVSSREHTPIPTIEVSAQTSPNPPRKVVETQKKASQSSGKLNAPQGAKHAAKSVNAQKPVDAKKPVDPRKPTRAPKDDTKTQTAKMQRGGSGRIKKRTPPRPHSGDEILMTLASCDTPWPIIQENWQRITKQKLSIELLKKRRAQLLKAAAQARSSQESDADFKASGNGKPASSKSLPGASNGIQQRSSTASAIPDDQPVKGNDEVPKGSLIKHPIYGGKTLSQEAWNKMYEDAEIDLSDAENPGASSQRCVRAPSPITDNDKIQYEYRVRRAFVTPDENAEVVWQYFGEASTKKFEVQKVASTHFCECLTGLEGKFQSQSFQFNSAGLPMWEATFDHGILHVRVERSVRPYEQQELPESKEGWVRSVCFVVRKARGMFVESGTDETTAMDHIEQSEEATKSSARHVCFYDQDLFGSVFTSLELANKQAFALLAGLKPPKSLKYDDVEEEVKARQMQLLELTRADECFDEMFEVAENKPMRVWVDALVLKGPRNI